MNNSKNSQNGIISLKKGGKRKMANLTCPKCFKKQADGGKARLSVMTVECTPDARMVGIVQCLICGHELPITIESGFIQKIDIALPGAQSDNLHSTVPPDIKEDIKEAERANYHQCYKACVTMCRRALQLGLIDKGIEDKPLQSMLDNALDKALLGPKTYSLATSIKGYGDIGAHRREELEPKEVDLVIYATVKMLNELFENSI